MIQTLSVADSIRFHLPDVTIDMLVAAPFDYWSSQSQNIRQTYTFVDRDHQKILQGETNKENLDNKTLQLIDKLNDESYDVIVNYQHLRVGPTLMKYLKAPVKKGAGFDQKDQLQFYDPWTPFLYLLAKNRKQHFLNLVTLYCLIAGFRPQHNLDRSRFHFECDDQFDSQKRLERFGLSQDEPYICLQMGASKSFRRWPFTNFLKLVRLLIHENRGRVILLGVAKESEVCHMITSSFPEVVNLCGKTDFLDLANLLLQAKYLITNDTGTMHLAAYLHTPFIALGASEVSCFQTAPVTFSEAYYVQPKLSCYPCEKPAECAFDYDCLNQISPEGVMPLVRKLDLLPFDPENERGKTFSVFHGSLQNPYTPYQPLQKVSGSEEEILDALQSILLPLVWNEVFDAHPEMYDPQEIFKKYYDISSFQQEEMIEIFHSEWDDINNLFKKAERAIQAYQKAIDGQDQKERVLAAKELELLDHQIERYEGVFRLITHYYIQQLKILSQDQGISLRGFLTANLLLLEKVGKLLKTNDALFRVVIKEDSLEAV